MGHGRLSRRLIAVELDEQGRQQQEVSEEGHADSDGREQRHK